MNDQPLLTVMDLSHWIRVKECTIRKWVCYNQIPYLKIGRLVMFKADDVKIWIRQRNHQYEKWSGKHGAHEKSYNVPVR